MSCNAAGTEALLNKMKWNGAHDWYRTPRGLWTSPVNANEPAGYAKSLHNLNFVVLYNSGHLAPYNQPANSLDLLRRFIDSRSYYDQNLPNYGDYVERMAMGETRPATNMILSQASVFPGASSLPQSTTETTTYGFGFLAVALALLAGFGLVYLRRGSISPGGYNRL
jgi:hypothetical protein